MQKVKSYLELTANYTRIKITHRSLNSVNRLFTLNKPVHSWTVMMLWQCHKHHIYLVCCKLTVDVETKKDLF